MLNEETYRIVSLGWLCQRGVVLLYLEALANNHLIEEYRFIRRGVVFLVTRIIIRSIELSISVRENELVYSLGSRRAGVYSASESKS